MICMRKIAKFATIKEILSGSVEIGVLLKTVGKVIDMIKNDYLKLILSHENSEIMVKVFDEPVGFIEYVLSNVNLGAYVLVIGYLKKIDGSIYIVAKGVRKIDEKLYKYYLLRGKLHDIKSS